MRLRAPRALNAVLRQGAPWLHQLLRQAVTQIGAPVPKLVNGKWVWAHHRLWVEPVWGESVLRWIDRYVKDGNVFFDVGAHHGWMSLFAAQRTGPRGRVVAFEPSPSSIEFLTYHKRVNRLAHMDLVPKAVSCSDASGIPFVIVGDGNAVMNSLVEIEEAKASVRGTSVIPVETITLDSYAVHSGLRPSVIKIDTEGSEWWVCQGATRLLLHDRPVLILATHPSWLPEGQKVEDLFAFLKEFRYRIVDSNIIRYRDTAFGDYLLIAD